MLSRSFNEKASAGVMIEWLVCMPCNTATGARSAEGALHFLPSLLFPVKVIA